MSINDHFTLTIHGRRTFAMRSKYCFIKQLYLLSKRFAELAQNMQFHLLRALLWIRPALGHGIRGMSGERSRAAPPFGESGLRFEKP